MRFSWIFFNNYEILWNYIYLTQKTQRKLVENSKEDNECEVARY